MSIMMFTLRRTSEALQRMAVLAACVAAIAGCATTTSQGTRLTSTGFAEFDRRARAGDHLNIVFLGGSLTWGANASDPQLTSYRARVARRLAEAYPEAHFRAWDAAIGGTGSQLAAFRLQRDVLSRDPDLVLVDFTANDDIRGDDRQRLASYESLVRRIIAEGDAPVVIVILPFRGDAEQGHTRNMTRRDAHLRLAQAYDLPVADAVTLVQQRLAQGDVTADKLWPWDGSHPNDAGYALFAEAVWHGFMRGVNHGMTPRAPDKPLHGDDWMQVERFELAAADRPLPAGWVVDTPSRTAAWYDGLMTRWLDSVVVARAGNGAEPQPLRAAFRGRAVALFGEETLDSGAYRVQIDAKPIAFDDRDTVDASAERFGGNRQHFKVLATDLDPDVEHTLTIWPVLDSGSKQELRFESICVSGPEQPRVRLLAPE